MSSLEIGLIGCGRWGKFVLRDLLALNCKVSVVARSELSKENAKAGGATKIVSAIAELNNVDAFVVCSTTTTHYQVILEIINRFGNKPIFCEKPVASSLTEARDLENRAPDNIFVMDKWRYHPGILALKDIVDNNSLGKVVGIQTVRVAWGSPHLDVDSIWILMPHDLSIVLEILGYIPDVTSAVADFNEDQVYGVTAILGKSPWVMSTVGARSIEYQRSVKLFCEYGVAELSDSYAEELIVVKSHENMNFDKPVVEKLALSKDMPLLEELKAFIKFVGGAKAPKSSLAEGVQIVQRISEIRKLAGIN
ncbi:MAG: Gfo/Idh/MocA family oxidoreductase [Proteobacteria bacterium]|nr:Gfo/Idh/MocA family oxidoreductase [Pseudomonadota bacterium]